ncbi:MAG: anti-sigma factor [Alphaproteobacteria bacterium]
MTGQDITGGEMPHGEMPRGGVPRGGNAGASGPIGEDDLQAFIDGRLSSARYGEVEAYLAQNPAVEDRVMRDREHRDRLRLALAGKLAEPIPARLRVATIRAARRASAVRRLRTVAAAALIFVAGAASGWVASRSLPMRSPAVGVAINAGAAYRTFVVEVAHPVEVGAAQEQHLMRWLSKRLGRNLTAPDLSQFGYSLIGGRLLPAGGYAAAQLMYENASKARLTVYVQAAPATETAFRFREEEGASTCAWIDRGYGFAVTAQVSRDALLPIAEAIYHDLDKAQDGAPGQSPS